MLQVYVNIWNIPSIDTYFFHFYRKKMAFDLIIEKIVSEKGLKYEDFANKIGVGKSSVYKWKRGESNPDFSALVSIIRNFPDIDTYWLLTGKGSMYGDSSTRKLGLSKGLQEGVIGGVIEEVSGSKETPMTAEERKQFREALEKIRQLEEQTRQMLEAHQGMTKAQQDMADTIKKLTEMLGDKRG